MGMPQLHLQRLRGTNKTHSKITGWCARKWDPSLRKEEIYG